MPCRAQTFTGIGRAAFERLVRQATDAGLPINGDQGEGEKGGFKVRWRFDENEQRLEIQCLSVPFWAPCSLVEGKVQRLVEECRLPV